jgi:hypothetical protein
LRKSEREPGKSDQIDALAIARAVGVRDHGAACQCPKERNPTCFTK